MLHDPGGGIVVRWKIESRDPSRVFVRLSVSDTVGLALFPSVFLAVAGYLMKPLLTLPDFFSQGPGIPPHSELPSVFFSILISTR